MVDCGTRGSRGRKLVQETGAEVGAQTWLYWKMKQAQGSKSCSFYFTYVTSLVESESRWLVDLRKEAEHSSLLAGKTRTKLGDVKIDSSERAPNEGPYQLQSNVGWPMDKKQRKQTLTSKLLKDKLDSFGSKQWRSHWTVALDGFEDKWISIRMGPRYRSRDLVHVSTFTARCVDMYCRRHGKFSHWCNPWKGLYWGVMD